MHGFCRPELGGNVAAVAAAAQAAGAAGERGEAKVGGQMESPMRGLGDGGDEAATSAKAYCAKKRHDLHHLSFDCMWWLGSLHTAAAAPRAARAAAARAVREMRNNISEAASNESMVSCCRPL